MQHIIYKYPVSDYGNKPRALQSIVLIGMWNVRSRYMYLLQRHFQHRPDNIKMWLKTVLHCVSQRPVHPSFGRVESQKDGQKLSKLHYKGGDARAVML